MNYKIYKDADKALDMIIDKTGDLGCGNSLSEKLQRLLDLPCECCNDGKVVSEQQQKIDRLSVLLGNALKALEEQSDESIMGTDFEDEIGITQEEYDEIVESDGTFSRYDTDKYEYTVVIESHINHKLCCDTYYPKTQNWDDILACYHCEKEQLIEDVHEKTPYDQEEWMLDGYRPITRIECENGDWYDIFVAESEKQY